MENRWSEEEAEGLSDLERLVYQSRLIGADPTLVIWGGGNTSLKVTRTDFRGRETRVLLVKGSGSDMKSAEARDFPGVRLEDVLPLFERSAMSGEDVSDYLERCLMEPGSLRPSIETLLHAFLPQTSVVHSHADAILSLTNTSEPQETIRQAFGNDLVVVPYRLSGFLLSREVALAALKHPGAKGVVLLNHGLVTWGSTPKASYDGHIELVTQAEEYISKRSAGRVVFGGIKVVALDEVERRRVAAAVTPSLRALVSSSGDSRMLLRFDDSIDVLNFVCSNRAHDLAEVGAATPDHLLNTGRSPLLVEVADPSYIGDVRRALEEGVEKYRSAYRDWFHQHKTGSVEMREPNPRVVLVPGLGMWVTGQDARALMVTSDIYHHTISIMEGAQGVGEYASLSLQDAYDAEYWPAELYKLTLLPTERELSRRVALVTGADRGIGKAIARRLAQEGANVVLTDIQTAGIQDAVEEINDEIGDGRCVAVALDVTQPEQVVDGFRQAVLAFGGLDILVSNAGVAPTGTLDQLPLADWQRSLDVNATGHLLVAREAVRIMREQGMGGSLVFIATKNVTAPGRGFGAYSAAKAAEAQLARVLAIENGTYGIRCNIINPDAIFQDSGLWSQELREERARAHGIAVSEIEDFYRRRNLLQAFVTAGDVAEAALYLAGDRSAKTTGCMITVDGGLPEAFPR
ncbi:MAG: bifunctional rhamnulose-1-phosphate aldolase/short-chain dehydrogenase [Dehalococcoidia bacterium]